MVNENMRNKIELYERICEMDHKGMNWADIAKELGIHESTVARIYLDGATGVLYRDPDVYNMVAKVVKRDVKRKGCIVLEKGIGANYHLGDGEFDAVVYRLEVDHGYRRVTEVRDGKRVVKLVRGV